METDLQLTAGVCSVKMLFVNNIIVRFTIVKLKYIINVLLVEYSNFRIYNYDVPIDKMLYCSWNLELKWCSWCSCQVTGNAVYRDHSIWGCSTEMVVNSYQTLITPVLGIQLKLIKWNWPWLLVYMVMQKIDTNYSYFLCNGYCSFSVETRRSNLQVSSESLRAGCNIHCISHRWLWPTWLWCQSCDWLLQASRQETQRRWRLLSHKGLSQSAVISLTTCLEIPNTTCVVNS